MTVIRRLLLGATAASMISGTALARTPRGSEDVLEIVVGNGPHAGTYKLPAPAIMCMRFKVGKNISAVYKDFDAGDMNKIGEAAINIANPDDTGPKRGDVLVAFGARDAKGASRYSLSIPTDSAGPLTFTRNGKGADMAFQGKTKDGISLRVTAKCAALEEL